MHHAHTEGDRRQATADRTTAPLTPVGCCLSPDDNAPTRLLLVEDNPGDAYLVTEMLAAVPVGGFDVRHVIRCAEAEQRAGDVDVILLDLSLPDAQGLEAVTRLRAAAPAVPIVITSGNTDEALAIAGVRAGAQDYLLKGRVDGDLLVRAVRYAIERCTVEAQLAEARASELALREANRCMEEFLSIAGHELRTPLTSVLGNVQLAVRWVDQVRQAKEDGSAAFGVRRSALGRASPEHQTPNAERLERVATLLQRVERQGRVLSRLVNEMLDIARIQAGRLALRPETTDLGALVREVVQEHQQRAPQRTIDLDVPSSEEVLVCADAERLAQVLASYLSNAVKYSAADQPVMVGLHLAFGDRFSAFGAAPGHSPNAKHQTPNAAARWARVWVRDRGPGLPAAEQARIWERFYRVPGIGHQDGASVGLGLGLHISRGIVERQGGQVGVASTPGEGAIFWFTVPLASSSLDE
ncbi:MAG TPA: hybrid sensor histidine kinase/response regulator [Chloroflexota bacterium]|nr:hybrid sensor histidine kinase/response regulator [Chloroflexota bacterium]